MATISLIWGLILNGIGLFGGYKAANWIIDKLNANKWLEDTINSIPFKAIKKIVSWTIVVFIYIISLVVVFNVAKLVLYPITRLIM